jgi:peptide/nickel transport system permease protein
MAVTAQSQSQPGLEAIRKRTSGSTFLRVIRYTGLRLVTLFITVVIGIYLTILIANMGGYVDNIMKGEITQSITQKAAGDPRMRSMSSDARAKLIQAEITLEENREGLNTPVAVRNFAYLSNALTLNLGTAINMNSDSGSKSVRLIVLERLPATLLLMGTSELSLFFVSLFLALTLSRRYGSFWDKLVIILSPTSTPPAWFYGIFFILLFAAIFKLLPFGGLMDAPPPTNPIDLGLNVIKHLILPASALFISQFFLSIYNWRTFFLIYSSEDYVEMAKAKGLPPRDIERQYILRPTLPTIITQFALLLIGVWQGAIVTETVFEWPGLGRTFYQAIGLFDTPVIVGLTIIYAYLLAITVFALDFVYALVDPRVKVGGS